jgi:rubrerythrin
MGDALKILFLLGYAVFLLGPLVLEDDRYARRWYRFTGKISGAIDQFIERVHQKAQSLWYRRKAGRCLKCGYDLLHNVSGVCPECGTPIHENRCVQK